MLTKVVPFGPWIRDGNFYGEGFLLAAANLAPLQQGYRGGFLPNNATEITVGGAASTVDIVAAYATNDNVYGMQYAAANAGTILRGNTTKPASLPVAYTAIDNTTYTGDQLGSIAQYGTFIVFASLNDLPRYVDEIAGGNTVELISTTEPAGSALTTAKFRARFAAPYKEHMVLANIVMADNYGATGSPYIFSNNQILDSLLWFSMQDNIRRYASPTVHPEVRGSVPLNLLDDSGPITALVGGEQMYVFKELAVYRIVGPPFDAIRIAKGIGTVSPKSIVDVDGTIFFLSNRGPAIARGDQCFAVHPETFSNAMRNSLVDGHVINRWYSSANTMYMIDSILQEENEVKYTVGMYSELIGCVVWVSRSGHYFAMQVKEPYGISYGTSLVSNTANPASVPFTVSAVAQSIGSNFYTDSWVNNILFGKLGGAGNVYRAVEKMSGFSSGGTTYPIKVTTPMLPLHMTEAGAVPCRISGFRIIGEARGTVCKWAIRTMKSWQEDPVFASNSGSVLTSRDGWVNVPSSYAGRQHSLSVEIDVDNYVQGEVETASMPFLSAVEISYTLDVGRTG